MQKIPQNQIDEYYKLIDPKIVDILLELSERNPIVESVFRFKDKNDLISKLSVALALTISSTEIIVSDIHGMINENPNLNEVLKNGEKSFLHSMSIEED